MAPPQVLCENCKAPQPGDKPLCAGCGGRVVRACGDCGFHNSLAKKFCDTCGSRIDGGANKQVGPSKPAPAAPAAPAAAPKKGKSPSPLEERVVESASQEMEEARQHADEKKQEPAEPRPSAAPPAEDKPAGPKPPALNAVAGLNLDAAPPPPPRSGADVALPHTMFGRAAARKEPPAKPGAADKGRLPADLHTPAPVHRPSHEPPPAAKPAEPPRKPAPGPPPRAFVPPARAPSSPPRLRPVTEGKTRPPEGTIRRAVSSPVFARASTALAVILLALGVLVAGMRRHNLGQPQVQSMAAARRYLNALRAAEYEKAYASLTEAAKRACPLAEFQKISDAAPWDYSDLRVLAVEGDTAFFSYRLDAPGKSPELDFMVWLREDGQWRRPFVWNLLRDFEDAFDRRDAAAALQLARAAEAVNPRDPQAAASACEALHALGEPSRATETEKECKSALELSQRYPAPMTLASDDSKHVRGVLAETYKDGLGRYQDAYTEYSRLLSLGTSHAEQCELTLGRAESSLGLGETQRALNDFTQASTVCEKQADTAYALRSLAIFSGGGKKEAIELAQQHPEPGGLTLLESRAQTRAETAREWKAQGRGPLPPEQWEADYVDGAQYRVSVRSGRALLGAWRVNLWDKSVQVEQ